MNRDESGFIAFAPDLKTRAYKNSVAKLLYESISGAAELSVKWNSSEQAWRSGEVIVSTESKRGETSSASLSTYNTSQWRGKLIVKKSAPSLSDLESEVQRQKINFGIHLHAAFSKINCNDDILLAINKMESDGDINSSEKKNIGTVDK